MGSMMKKMILSLLLVCFFVTMSVCGTETQAAEQSVRTEAAVFYVDSVSGDDTAAGTSVQTPWKTLAHLMEAASPFVPGDQILFKAGSVFYESLTLEGSGTEDAPITVDIYNGNVIGKEAGARAAIHANGQASCAVLLEDVSYWNVSNLEISNDAGNNNTKRVGINVEITEPGVQKGFHFDNLYVHDVTGTLTDKDIKNGGIFFAVSCPTSVIGNTETHFEDILVENCYVRDVSRTGMSIGATTKDADSYGYGGRLPADFIEKYYHTNVVIRNNYVQRSGGDAIVPMYCVSPLIEYNVSDGASQNTKANPNAMYNAAIWPWRCEDALFQYNEAFGTVLNGDGQAFDCDFSVGTVYQYNYSHDNEGGFMLVCQGESLESVVRYNISQNDMRSLFMLSNSNEAVFYNNTFYIGEGLRNIVDDYGGRASMYNNIFYSAAERNLGSWGSNVSYDNNLYYQCAALPTDANQIVADPNFKDPGKGGAGVLGDSAIDTLSGYQLLEDSPAIDAGKVIADNGGRDYFGNEITDAPDIGAVEYHEEIIEEPEQQPEQKLYPVKTVQLSKVAYTYDGKVKTPSVIVKDTQGNTLKKDADYTVSYERGCKNPGKYTVTVEFIGNYKETAKKTLTFTIELKNTAIKKLEPAKKSFKVKWKKVSGISGYEIQYSAQKNFKKKSTKRISAKSTSTTIKKLKAKKKYYIRIRTYKKIEVNGKYAKFYSDWSKVKTVRVK